MRTRQPSIGRSRAASADLLRLITRLQPRDLVIGHLLAEQRTLTTPQIAAVLFGCEATARNRLYRLRAAGWVDCFTPTRAGGRLPTHWVPGPLSATYVAHHHGRPPPSPKALRQRREAIAASSHLEHLDGANQFFIDLLTHTRSHPGCRLARWWSPTRAAAATGRRIHPDGHGSWEVDGHQAGFWLEHDTGTETIGRLIDKLEAYRRLRRDGGPDYPVLFHLPNPARETNLHRRLNGRGSDVGLTIATACHHDHPAGRVWEIAGNGRGRRHLADLPSTPGRAGPYHPGPPTAEDDPLRQLRADPPHPTPVPEQGP